MNLALVAVRITLLGGSLAVVVALARYVIESVRFSISKESALAMLPAAKELYNLLDNVQALERLREDALTCPDDELPNLLRVYPDAQGRHIPFVRSGDDRRELTDGVWRREVACIQEIPPLMRELNRLARGIYEEYSPPLPEEEEADEEGPPVSTGEPGTEHDSHTTATRITAEPFLGRLWESVRSALGTLKRASQRNNEGKPEEPQVPPAPPPEEPETDEAAQRYNAARRRRMIRERNREIAGAGEGACMYCGGLYPMVNGYYVVSADIQGTPVVTGCCSVDCAGEMLDKAQREAAMFHRPDGTAPPHLATWEEAQAEIAEFQIKESGKNGDQPG